MTACQTVAVDPASSMQARCVDHVDAIAARTATIVDALRVADLDGPSLLPGWSRLTIACHLRFGAVALARITDDALAGRPASYYPEGRAAQRPGTLEPMPGESAADVVASLAAESDALHRRWGVLDADGWATVAHEPHENPDLGDLPLETLAILRWTEVEVHGIDLDVGLPDWNVDFTALATPFRLLRMDGRPTTVTGAWTLRSETASYGIVADGHVVRAAAGDAGGTAIEASDRDLLAVLLGRPTLEPVDARSFRRAFPGP